MKTTRAILFDLDGTLLPMDLDEYTRGYFRLLAKKVAGRGYEPEALIAATWKGTEAMVGNDGGCPNKERFWSVFASILGERVYEDIPVFDEFYGAEYDDARAFTSPEPEKAQRAVATARRLADKVILASNPLYPRAAYATRLGWLGLSLDDFDYVSTYENSSYCKPSPAYYQAILAANDLDPADCVMVGNDIEEDILAVGRVGAAGGGIRSLLVTDCLIDKRGLLPHIEAGKAVDGMQSPIDMTSTTLDGLSESLTALFA